MDNKQQNIQIKVSDEVLKGVYSNNVMISHTQSEFLMDFMSIFHPAGVLGARVIISPNHAKRIVKALQNNISMYENKFGEIKEAPEPTLTDKH